MTIIEKLSEFIKNADNSGPRNLWIEDENMKVYVRKSRRLLAGKMICALDIATISVDESKQRQGFCTNFLTEAHESNPWDATFVECVLDKNLSSSLIRRGWILKEGEETESFFMPKDIAKYYDQILNEKNQGVFKEKFWGTF